jgi:transcriptional regulator with XRE-family HTH domain
MAERPNQRKLVGERLRTAREAKGLRLKDVAVEAGVSLAFVCDVEAGNRGIAEERRAAFARAVDLPVADLTELDPATLAVVEARLVAAGRCDRAVRVVREMAGGGA